MRFINSLDSKFVYSLQRLRKNAIKILKDVLSVCGGLIVFAEAIYEVFGYITIFSFYKQHFCIILLLLLAFSIWKNWDHLEVACSIIESPDVSITLKVCDALKNEGAVIIPTNTTFDTLMDDDFISKKSLQGQYQVKYYNNNLSSLDNAIAEGLIGKKYVQLNDGRKTKEKRYPIGTVCRVSGSQKRAYFLADSDINKNGIPVNVDMGGITSALVNLWSVLSEIGNKETYSIPLLGTGRAGVRDASRDDIIKDIIHTFLAATKDYKITENLIICIHPSDYRKIHWDDLCEYLKYHCQFNNIKPPYDYQQGTPENTSVAVALKEDRLDIFVDELQSDEINDLSFSSKQKMALALLQGNEMTLSEVAEALGLSARATSQLLSTLLKRKLIKSTVFNQKKYYKAEKNGTKQELMERNGEEWNESEQDE